MKKYFKELGSAFVLVIKEIVGFIKYMSEDFEKENKTWRNYFKED